MDQAWWGMVAVVVVGAAVVFVGWSRDRRHNARAAELAAEPPRPLPGVGNGDGDKPQYVQEADLAGVTPPRPAATVADPSDGESNAAGGAGGPVADLDAVLDRRQNAATVPAGVPEDFVNVPEKRLAVLLAPAVIVTDAEITHDREVNALLQAAARRGRPLVIVAPGFAPAALATLRANAVTGKLPNLPIQLSESRELRKAVALTGGQLVEDGDLAAGSLPDSTWGTCEAWIADLDNSWIVVSGRP